MVKRKENWALLLSKYLHDRRAMPFEWGKNDCMAFVSNAVRIMTGKDFFPDFSDYTDQESAIEMLKKNGGPVGIISQCLGHDGSKNVLAAGRGDVVIAKLPQIETGEFEITGGIVDDSGRFFCVAQPHGLIRYPLNKALRYWSF